MKDFAVGVDVGNYDTKSQHTITPSGYSSYSNKPLMAKETLFYDGIYYVPSLEERLPYVMDKTANNQALILTLFGIAKEILYYFNNNPNYKDKLATHAELQEEIRKIESISIGVGLPPGHIDKLSENTEKYYNDVMKNGISFWYKNTSMEDIITFNFKLSKVKVFPQDFSAVLINKDLAIPTTYQKYVVVGIGGYTVDVVPVIGGESEATKCKSLNLGTRTMYEEIISKVLSATGTNITERSIEDVFFDRPNILDEEIVNIIKNVAEERSALIVNRCQQAGIEFSENPVVFVGGGSLLLKNYLTKNRLIKKSEFVESVYKNAENYAKFLQAVK